MTRRAIFVLAIAVLAMASPAFGATGSDFVRGDLTLSGGFHETGQPPTDGLTEWAVMGLRAAGGNPATMRLSGGRTPVGFLAGHVRGWTDAFSLERGILGVVALHGNPTTFGGRNLISALRAKVVPSTGRIGSYANSTYWGALALRGARQTLPRLTVSWIESHQQSNGGYSYSSSIPAGTDTNDTAAAVLALRAGGVSCSSTRITRAYTYMHTAQSSGGYALLPGGAPDSQSTSWIVQSRHACGLSNTGALAWLAARHSSNGSYYYSPGNHQTPVFVTSQVLPATNGRWYPIS
jgi:hypothetical protein